MEPLPQRQLKSRTIATVAEDLNRTSAPGKPTDSHFLNCRYDPFGKTPIKTYIPDGKGRNVVVRDIKFAHNINIADKESMNIEISPCLPFPVAFASDGYCTSSQPTQSTVDGYVLGGITTGGPGIDSASYLRTVFPNVMNQTLTYTDLGETNNVLSARITTIGYRLYYTGPASAAQGVIIATDHAWNLEYFLSSNTSGANQYRVQFPAAAATIDTVAANTSAEFNISAMSMSTTQAVTSQTVVRPENGLRGILKMQLPPDAHDFTTWLEQGAIVTRPDTTSGTTNNVNLYTRSMTAFPTGTLIVKQFMYDPALMATNIKVTGAGSYRLEVAICYEQELSLNHKFIDMARQSPMIDRRMLDVDATLNSTVHPSGLAQPIVDLTDSMAGLRFRRGNTRSTAKQKAPRRRRNRRRRRSAKQSPCGKGKNKGNVQIRVG